MLSDLSWNSCYQSVNNEMLLNAELIFPISQSDQSLDPFKWKCAGILIVSHKRATKGLRFMFKVLAHLWRHWTSEISSWRREKLNTRKVFFIDEWKKTGSTHPWNKLLSVLVVRLKIINVLNHYENKQWA